MNLLEIKIKLKENQFTNLSVIYSGQTKMFENAQIDATKHCLYENPSIYIC